jgi:hypothetical protein
VPARLASVTRRGANRQGRDWRHRSLVSTPFRRF